MNESILESDQYKTNHQIYKNQLVGFINLSAKKIAEDKLKENQDDQKSIFNNSSYKGSNSTLDNTPNKKQSVELKLTPELAPNSFQKYFYELNILNLFVEIVYTLEISKPIIKD